MLIYIKQPTGNPFLGGWLDDVDLLDGFIDALKLGFYKLGQSGLELAISLYGDEWPMPDAIHNIAPLWRHNISNGLRIDAHAEIPPEFIERNVNYHKQGEMITGGARPNIIDRETAWKRTLLMAESSMFGSSIADFRHNSEKRYVKSIFDILDISNQNVRSGNPCISTTNITGSFTTPRNAAI